MTQKEQVFLNSCQLVLQQFSTRQKGFIYFVWKKGKKHTQSLKYHCTDEITPIKETLTLSLKTYSFNGQMQKRYTHFSLFDGQGREIDHVKFDVTEWKPEQTEKKIILGTCNLRMRVRRKMALQLQNFHRLSKTQIQQSSTGSQREGVDGMRTLKKEQLSVKEQLAKARRELQDSNFITNKLKNDRNFYISENQNLRQQLSQIHQQYGSQIAVLKNHYQTRIQIRQSIYQQQIQQLISTFNQNYSINTALIQGLVHQKYEYQTQIAQMKQIHQIEIQKQQESYQAIISQLQHNKRTLKNEIKDYIDKLAERQGTIAQLSKQFQETRELLLQTREQLAKEMEQHGADEQKWEKQMEEKQMTIYKNNQQIEAMHIQIDTKDFQLKQNQAALQHYRKLIEELQNSIVQKEKINNQSETEKYNLTVEIQRLKVSIEQQTSQIEFHRASIQQLKEQDKIKQQEYLSQYRSLESIYNEKQIMFTDQLKSEHQKFLEVNKENYDLNVKIQQLEHQLSLLLDQNAILKNDNQQTIQMAEQLREEMKLQSDAFTKQYREYNQQIADLMTENNVYEAENHSLKDQIRELERKIEVDTANLKRDYQDLLQSKIKLYEDELQFTRRQRDADMENFERLKTEYESEISSLIERETKQNDEVQKIFRDEMELKNKEFIELKQSYSVMIETYDDLKIRLQIAEEERDNLKRSSKGKRANMNYDHEMLIEQIQEESEDISEQEQQSDEESDSSEDRRRKKNKNKQSKKDKEKEKEKKKKAANDKKQKEKKKKKKKVQSSQSEQQSEAQSQVSQPDPSYILAKIPDDNQYAKKQKNLVQSNQVNAGSMKMIPVQMQDSPQKRQSSFLPAVISIQVPVDEPYNEPEKSDNLQLRSSSQRKKRKTSSNHDESIQRDNSRLLKAEDEVRQLQKQIKKLKKQLKEHQRNQTIYMTQIQDQEEQIKSLNTEIDNLVKKVSKKDPKLAKNISAQIQEKRQEKSNSNKSHSDMSVKIPPPVPRKEIQNMKMENQYLKRSVEEKNRNLAALESEKLVLVSRLQSLETVKIQLEKRIGGGTQQQVIQSGGTSQLQQDLKRSVMQFEGKFMSQKQKTQQVKLQLNKAYFQKQQLQNENKKLRIKLQDMEQTLKKQQPSQTQRQMQKEIEDYNRQFMDMSKSLNSTKIQKQATEEQLRLMKKRYSQIIRASQQAETKASNLQREVEDLRRKENRSRRDIQDHTEQINKYKEQIKHLQGQLNSLTTMQNQSVYERKKVMDEMMRLEDLLSNKQFQASKLSKEIQKLRQKLQEGDDLKINKRNQLLQERERLESLLIKAEKKVKEVEEQDNLLKKRIQVLERENKKNLQEKKQTYGEKLRFYIEEISSIKQIVDEYQNQNSRLKIQNSQLFEHNQILKMSFQKLQLKYQQMVDNEGQLLQQLQIMQKDIDLNTDINNQQKQQLQTTNITINNLRKQLDTERTVSKKKSDKLTAYQELNEKYLYEIKTLKIKLSEFQTNLNQNELLTEKHQKNTKTIQQLQHQLNNLQEQYTHVINTYTYRKEDVQQAMKQLKDHQEKVKEEEITRVIEELDSTYTQKQASMEQEIIELFNQNSKLRLNLQNKNDQNAQFLAKLSETQTYPQKLKNLQSQRDNYQRTTYQLNQQLKTLAEELRRADSKLNESIRNQQGKTTENAILLKKCEDIERKYRQLNDSFVQMKRQEKKLLQRIKILQQEKQKQVDKLRGDIQHYQNKILSLQLQLGRLKQLGSVSSKDFVKKTRSLQQKIQQMQKSFKQREQSMQGQYLTEIKKLQDTLQKLSEQLQQKMHRIEELNQALIMLQSENEDLVGELTATRRQLAQEGQLYTNQVNILRNQLSQAQQLYDANIKTLQEEMSLLSKELTVLRFNRQSSSRELKGSGVGMGEGSVKRYEEKIRLRDKRIEQLKMQIVKMEEDMNQLMQKQNNNQNISQREMEKLKQNLISVEEQLKQLRHKYENEHNINNQTVKSLKRQVGEWRGKLEERELTLQQRQLQMQSIKVELKTTKQLYSQLQQQLQKRKTHLNTQRQQDSQLQTEIRLKTVRINQLTQKLQETTTQKLKIQTQLKRKSLQLKRLTQRLNQVQINYNDLNNNQEKKNNQIKAFKQSKKQLEEKLQKIITENNKLKNQITLREKENHTLKEQLEKHNQNLLKLQQKLQQLTFISQKHQQHARKYKQLQQLLEKQLHITLEEYCNIDYWNQQLNQKDQDIQVLADQLEELRFLYQHQNIENNQLKKIHYQLQIKAEDNQFVYSQVNQLRNLCTHLDQEKKDAIFREQALKLQLENIIQSEDRNNLTLKLQNILNGSFQL